MPEGRAFKEDEANSSGERFRTRLTNFPTKNAVHSDHDAGYRTCGPTLWGVKKAIARPQTTPGCLIRKRTTSD